MNLEISHLVVNGCSFTYCQGLEKPWLQGWPALLAKKLDVPVVNLAVGGSGNDSIHRRTYEYHYKNLTFKNSKPLYIIAFSHATRREEWFTEYKGRTINDYLILDLGASSVDLIATLGYDSKIFEKIHEYEFAHLNNLSFEACERKKVLLWNSILNLFNSNNIPYLVGDYMPTEDDKTIDYVRTNFTRMYDNIINDPNNVGDLAEKVKHFDKLPCKHDGYEAQQVICDLFYDKIKEKYSNIVPLHTPYLTLQDFYDEHAKELLNWHEWIKNT